MKIGITQKIFCIMCHKKTYRPNSKTGDYTHSMSHWDQKPVVQAKFVLP